MPTLSQPDSRAELPSGIPADIIDHAAALFARRGFDQTSMQQIADAARQTRETLLTHFALSLIHI